MLRLVIDAEIDKTERNVRLVTRSYSFIHQSYLPHAFNGCLNYWASVTMSVEGQHERVRAFCGGGANRLSAGVGVCFNDQNYRRPKTLKPKILLKEEAARLQHRIIVKFL